MVRIPVPFAPVAASLAILAAPALAAQDGLPPAHQDIDFLVGQWETTSEFPDGRTGDGELEYRWVFGGGWMKVEFRGEPPDGGMWEAHVMQRWNPDEDAYEAWVFRDGGSPLRYLGAVAEPGLYRIEHTDEHGVTIGIDYHRQEDGTVYQENWRVEDGEREVTLRTTYRRAGG